MLNLISYIYPASALAPGSKKGWQKNTAASNRTFTDKKRTNSNAIQDNPECPPQKQKFQTEPPPMMLPLLLNIQAPLSTSHLSQGERILELERFIWDLTSENCKQEVQISLLNKHVSYLYCMLDNETKELQRVEEALYNHTSWNPADG